MTYLPAIGVVELGLAGGLVARSTSAEFEAHCDGVDAIIGLTDGSVDFIVKGGRTSAIIHTPPGTQRALRGSAHR